MNHNSCVKGTCYHCEKETEWKLGCTIATNGAKLVYWVCKSCNRRAEKARNIKHGELFKRGIKVDYIEILQDNTGYKSCARCGVRTSEYHHWAPKHLFDDADDWPGDYLCRECHLQWHNTVTPNMCEVKHGKT